ncbi:MAG: L-seryl-tRNA(Sec) selenium transferase, partial [Deltaproteobacteria bacterium]|nr:L-seryl-tRNA(Sec) selenium transferase [Deltaproteobacteria bacterium]
MQPLLERYPRNLVVDSIRLELDAIKKQVVAENLQVDEIFSLPAFFTHLTETLEIQMAPRLKRVINATGVVIHTNLGRSPLPTAALEQANAIACRYSNLEYNLESG